MSSGARGDFSLASSAPTVRASVASPPQDRRFAYPALARASADSADLAVGAFTGSFTTAGLSGVTGVDRDPISTGERAELEATIGWESRDLQQFATVLDNAPQAVLGAEAQLRGCWNRR